MVIDQVPLMVIDQVPYASNGNNQVLVRVMVDQVPYASNGISVSYACNGNIPSPGCE